MLGALDGSQLLAICMLAALMVGAAWHFVRTRGEASSQARAPTPRTCPKPFSLITIGDAFDPERAILWETQIPALQLISGGVPAARLFLLYACYPKRYPELFEGATFEEWLQFLKQCNLVEVAAGEIRLTAEGSEFLGSLRPAPEFSGAGGVQGQRRGAISRTGR